MPLLIVKNALRLKDPWWVLFGMAVVFYSPFGLAFYVKDPPAIRKELFFFFPFYWLSLYGSKKATVTNVLIVIFIVLSSFIHESFFFLFLPFLLAYLFLNEWINKKWLLIHAGVGIVATFLLSLTQGNSERIAENFMQQYVNLGFGREQFTAFDYFQKLPSSENIASAFHHFTTVGPAVHLAFYVAHFYFLYVLFRCFNIAVLFKNLNALLVSLGLIALMAFVLCFIAMDYGRWFSMAYSTSLILCITQVKSIEFGIDHKSIALRRVVCILMIGAILLIRIPHFTAVRFNSSEWILVFRLFIKDGFIMAVIVVGLGALLEYLKVKPKAIG
ncbi:hypothetical protein EHT87_29995 [Larkinella knui]|uniref:Uncharacterized protein n=2 Tax=Larkinella knui TaxID=2025310 RepID=A0A3P1CBK9_9BACT|nr:hypothetical protein EHT87_29995 [Larkinella knui]